MAKRPVFIPQLDNEPVKTEWIEFAWNPGFSKEQKQKNVEELHKKAKEQGIYPVLEISTKSTDKLGVKLSAFNLQIKRKISVESAFQSSKVFENGGPYRYMLNLPGPQIKKDERLKNSGKLIYFLFEDTRWELEPKGAFYDWLYISALKQVNRLQNNSLIEQLLKYKGFTDIEFNPKKQINCQAHSAALYVSLYRRGILEEVTKTKDSFLKFLKENYKREEMRIPQPELFLPK